MVADPDSEDEEKKGGEREKEGKVEGKWKGGRRVAKELGN